MAWLFNDIERTVGLIVYAGAAVACWLALGKRRERAWWCALAVAHTALTLDIALHLRHKGVGLRLTTLNRHAPPHSIEMELAEGPFKRLTGVWTFTPLTDDACKVGLEMDFAFSSPVHAGLLKPLFSRVTSALVDAFVARAKEVYG